MPDPELDTGEVAEVPEDQQLDVDEGPGELSDTSDDPDIEDDDFADLYEDPGEVVEEDLG